MGSSAQVAAKLLALMICNIKFVIIYSSIPIRHDEVLRSSRRKIFWQRAKLSCLKAQSTLKKAKNISWNVKTVQITHEIVSHSVPLSNTKFPVCVVLWFSFKSPQHQIYNAFCDRFWIMINLLKNPESITEVSVINVKQQYAQLN